MKTIYGGGYPSLEVRKAIEERLSPMANEYKILSFGQVSPAIGPFDPEYIKIRLKRLSSAYMREHDYTRFKKSIGDLFSDSAVWTSVGEEKNELIVLIRDIKNTRIWQRIR